MQETWRRLLFYDERAQHNQATQIESKSHVQQSTYVIYMIDRKNIRRTHFNSDLPGQVVDIGFGSVVMVCHGCVL